MSFIHKNDVVISKTDVLDETKMDNLYVAMRIRHHLRSGVSHDEAMNRTFNETQHKGLGTREGFAWSDVTGALKSATGACLNDISGCAQKAMTVYNTGKCLKSGGGLAGSIGVAVSGSPCPTTAATTQPVAAVRHPVAAVRQNGPSCYIEVDPATQKQYFWTNKNKTTSWDPPAVECGCWEQNGASYNNTSKTWVNPSVCEPFNNY